MKTLSDGKSKHGGVAAWTTFILIAIVMNGLVGCGSTLGVQVLTQDLAEPLNGAATAKIDVNTGIGNLTIDSLAGDEQLLANGSLQYLENQGAPVVSFGISGDQASLAVKASDPGKSWFRLPWQSGAETANEWQIHLNSRVPSDITASTGGGNVKLDLVHSTVTRLSADSGGGDLEVTLPESAANLDVTAKTGGGNITIQIGRNTTGSNTVNASSGGGNVAVSIPRGLSARIHVASGMGKIVVDPRFSKIDDKTYQSPDYNSATNKIEITATSGAGNVSVNSN